MCERKEILNFSTKVLKKTTRQTPLAFHNFLPQKESLIPVILVLSGSRLDIFTCWNIRGLSGSLCLVLCVFV